MNQAEWAYEELKLSGLLDPDSDYNGAAGDCILEIMKLFSSQHHSGGSASIVIAALERLLNWHPLVPLTYQPDEWYDRSVESGGSPLWQNKRDPSVFSEDEGLTWYSVEDDSKAPFVRHPGRSA